MRKIILFGIIMILLAGIVCADRFTYETREYEVHKGQEYDVVYINNGLLWEIEGFLNEPVGGEQFNVLADKAIKSITIVGKENPVNLKMNLPVVKYADDIYYGYEDRECISNQRDAYIDYYKSYGDESQIVVEFHPLEIVDCEKGEFILYQNMEIEVEYYEKNKIKSVEHSGLNPGSETTIEFEFENVEDGDQILVQDYWFDEVAYEYVDSGKMTITAEIPVDISDFFLVVEYYNVDDEIVDRYLIKEDFAWGTFDFRVLVSDDAEVFPLAIEIENTKGTDISISLDIISMNFEEEAETTIHRTLTASPGKSMHFIEFKITENEVSNDITISATYNGITETVEHNSLIRFTEEEIQNGLPPPPGAVFAQEFAEILEEDYDEAENVKKTSEPTKKSTIIAVIAAISLFIIVGYVGLKYAGKE